MNDDFPSRVERERPYLLRYAALQLRDTHAAEDAVQDTLVALFSENGHWVDPPAAGPDPGAALEQQRFFATLQACLERLPQKIAQAFMMREHLGLETGEICKELAITPTHCWVLLYRARVALRECLEKEWFGK